MAYYNNSQYPTAADLTAFCVAAGIDLPATFDATDPMLSAISEWESRTGWFPYLAGSAETRLFSPPSTGPRSGMGSATRGGRLLQLNAGILNMPDNGMRIGVIAGSTGQLGVTSAASGSLGTVLTRNIQYFLGTDGAEYKNQPWTEVEFTAPIFGMRKSIAITATWGRTFLLEPDIWYVLLQRGFSNARPQLAMFTSGGANKVADEHSSVSFDGGVFSSETTQINALFNAAVTRKKRVTT